MKVGLASDLHFEFNDAGWLPPLPGDCDVMVLAGDIAVGDKAISAVSRIAEMMPNAQIIWVAGNHEFYKCSIDKQLKKFKAAFVDNSRIHFLENSQVDIGGYTFLGCTLWTGFDCMGKEQQALALNEALDAIYDFRVIRTDQHTKPFRPQDAMTHNYQSKLWLEAQLAVCDPDKTIVVTHFPPSRVMRHGVIPEDLLGAYFQANCDDLINEYQPALWLYGHNHWSDDKLFNSTRVVSNQLGYPGEEATNERYQGYFIIDI